MSTHKAPRRPARPLADTDPEDREDLAGEPFADEAGEPEDAKDAKDTGDLYGVHTPAAADRELSAPEDEDSYADSELGENWLEALEARSAEGGVTPEHEVVIVDDGDETTPATDFRDRPKADRGSGGPGGL